MAQDAHADAGMQMPGMGQGAAAAANLQMQQLHMQQQQHLQQQQLQLQQFWAHQMAEIQKIDPEKEDFKVHELPLARIKKIMKIEDEIKAELGGHRFMISAEAPVVFAKACEMFILEVTLRAWAHTEENKRRTLQKNDISMAVSKTDQYDFLIDIVPRDDVKPHKKEELGRLPLVDPQLLFMQPQMAMLAPGMQIQDPQQLQLLQQQQLQPQMMWGQQAGMYYPSQSSHGQEYSAQGYDPSVLMGMPSGASMGDVQGQSNMGGMHGSSHYGDASSMQQMGMMPPHSMSMHGHHMGSGAAAGGGGASMGSSTNMGGNM